MLPEVPYEDPAVLTPDMLRSAAKAQEAYWRRGNILWAEERHGSAGTYGPYALRDDEWLLLGDRIWQLGQALPGTMNLTLSTGSTSSTRGGVAVSHSTTGSVTIAYMIRRLTYTVDSNNRTTVWPGSWQIVSETYSGTNTDSTVILLLPLNTGIYNTCQVRLCAYGSGTVNSLRVRELDLLSVLE